MPTTSFTPHRERISAQHRADYLTRLDHGRSKGGSMTNPPAPAVPQNSADETENQVQLFIIELKIAQRADILARDWPITNGLRLGCWLHAEQEVLHSAGLLPPPTRPARELISPKVGGILQGGVSAPCADLGKVGRTGPVRRLPHPHSDPGSPTPATGLKSP